ncbi:hypothetical protein [Streptomyces sp. NPDC006463]|uniref:hypothetical protein n=1 Tax=Streptomyces sp. NPDC006463 TaxID=3364746 RepID=UPI00367D6529
MDPLPPADSRPATLLCSADQGLSWWHAPRLGFQHLVPVGANSPHADGEERNWSRVVAHA